jgi:HAD superfamily hydrolase (TIGR01509 family)
MQQNRAKPVKVIIFDLGKVIVDFDHFAICKKLARYCPVSANEIYRIIFKSGLEKQFDEGAVTSYKFFAKLKQQLQLDIAMATFEIIWNRIFKLNQGIAPLIKTLKKDYRLLCLSNTNKLHFEYCLKKFPLLRYFDGFILSYKIKKRKPHHEIFEAALSKARCPAHACLYIDDIAEYVQTAEALGMKAIHFKSVHQLKRQLKMYLAD